MTLRSARAVLLAALALAAGAGTASAQVFTPPFLSPRPGADVGVYLSAGVAPNDGLAVEGLWRASRGSYGLGLRGGLGEVGGALSLIVGGDYRNPLPLDLEPVEVSVTGGAQLALGGSAALGVDAGVSAGHPFELEGVAVTAYVHPRLALVAGIPGGASPDLSLLVDLGADVELGEGRTFRAAFGLGRHTATLGVGLGWR